MSIPQRSSRSLRIVSRRSRVACPQILIDAALRRDLNDYEQFCIGYSVPAERWVQRDIEELATFLARLLPARQTIWIQRLRWVEPDSLEVELAPDEDFYPRIEFVVRPIVYDHALTLWRWPELSTGMRTQNLVPVRSELPAAPRFSHRGSIRVPSEWDACIKRRELDREKLERAMLADLEALDRAAVRTRRHPLICESTNRGRRR
jgi:hypothetical protein